MDADYTFRCRCTLVENMNNHEWLEQVTADRDGLIQKCQQLQAENARLREALEKQLSLTCKWIEAETLDDLYETYCDNVFQFETGKPEENDFVYCPFCGRKIVVVAQAR